MFSSVLGVSSDSSNGVVEPPAKIAKKEEEDGTVTETANHKILTALLDEYTDVWENVVSFLDDKSARNVAACSSNFYEFFCVDAQKCLAAMKPYGENDFIDRALTNEKVHSRLVEPRGEASSSLSSSSTRTKIPWRYVRKYAYSIPVLRAKGVASGAACKCIVDGNEYMLTLVGGAAETGGLVVRQNPQIRPSEDERLGIVEFTLTDPANPGPMQRYGGVWDTIWWCPSLSSSSSSSGNAGYLVVKHGTLGRTRLSIIDLSETDQEIALANDSTVRGAKQHRLVRYDSDTGEELSNEMRDVCMFVSEKLSRIFFVRFLEEDGKLEITSYDVSSRELVQSTSHQIASSPHFEINGVITEGKLVLVLHSEHRIYERDAGRNGLGIYVFDSISLDFCTYSPSEFDRLETIVYHVSPGFVLFANVETHDRSLQPMRALPIRGGKVGTPVRLELTGHIDELFVSDTNQLYTYSPDDREGTITFDQIDLVTGKKKRRLDTGIPWMHRDENDDDNTRPHGFHRMLDSGLTVGNNIVILISSVGSHINSAVTFVKPPPHDE